MVAIARKNFMVMIAMSDNLMFVPAEVHYFMLSSDVVVVYSSIGSRVYVTIVLAVAGKLFMPVNCLYDFSLVV